VKDEGVDEDPEGDEETDVEEKCSPSVKVVLSEMSS